MRSTWTFEGFLVYSVFRTEVLEEVPDSGVRQGLGRVHVVAVLMEEAVSLAPAKSRKQHSSRIGILLLFLVLGPSTQVVK